MPKTATLIADRPRSRTPVLDVSAEKYVRLGKDGKFHVDIDKRRPNGTQFRKCSKFTTLEKALRARDEWLKLFETDHAPQKLTLDAWAKECFGEIMPYPHTRKDGLKPGTIHGYKLLYDLHASPILGKLELRNIKTEQVMNLLHRRMAHRDADTRANMRSVLSKLFTLAQAMERVPLGYNPVKLVTVPRNGPKYDEDGNELQHVRNLTIKEQDAFLKHAQGSWAYLGFLIGFRMGMRTGEILGFNLRYVDWKKRLYSVREQVIRQKGTTGRGGKIEPSSVVASKSLKKEGSYRTIPIPPSIFTELESIRTARPNTTYVFVHPDDGSIRKGSGQADGRHRRPEDFAIEFRLIATSAGLLGCKDSTGAPLKDPTPHDMRHSFGFLHANVYNTPHTALQKLMGHRNITTTLAYYAVAGVDDVIAAMRSVP